MSRRVSISGPQLTYDDFFRLDSVPPDGLEPFGRLPNVRTSGVHVTGEL